jgi:hypothetical protein
MGSVIIDYNSRTVIVHFPHKCPICHRLIDVGAYANSLRGASLELGFVCTNPECRRLFIASYRIDGSYSATLIGTTPGTPDLEGLSDVVRALSPTFVDIYREALTAQSQGMIQIAGPGFRKAFEFLVKDYAKSLVTDEKAHEQINSTPAGTVVSTHIHDPRIQAVAKRALWLGNDETHYIRRWTDHDIDDLLTLIRLSIAWIEIERLSKSYVDEMPE